MKETMTSRQRVLVALNHQKPDRTPRLLYDELIGYVPAVEEMLKRQCSPLSPCEYFQMDMTSVSPNPTRLSKNRFQGWLSKEAFDDNTSVDEWGVWWKKGSFHHFAHINSPLTKVSGLKELREYPWPDFDEPYRYEGLSEKVNEFHKKGLAVAGFAGSIFEQAWYLRSMPTLLVDMMLRPDIAHYLLEHTAHFQRKTALEFARAGIDMVMLGDDVAMQTGLMMSIQTWQNFLKQPLKKTIDVVKTENQNCKVFYHSDGNVEGLIPELIEVGIDVLNPVQPECMNPAKIKQEYGDKLAFLGTISVQRTMPFGSPQDVSQEVKTRIETVGYDGGLILAPSHVLEPEVPFENIKAFFETVDSMKF